MSNITVYEAKKIITMNESRPKATHVAIRDGRILGTGTLAEMDAFGAFSLNKDFADKVLMPGFVEGHAHAIEGGVWSQAYVGYMDRYDPDGNLWHGSESMDAVVATLQRLEAAMDDPDTPFRWRAHVGA